MSQLPRHLHKLLPFSAFILLAGCSTIANFDQDAYKNATSLKVEALVLMNKATESFPSHNAEVDRLQIDLDKAYEYDRNRPINEITVLMWDKLRNTQGDLLGGFFWEWKEDGPMLPRYVERKRTQIGRGFDTIIQLESGKMKPSEAAKSL